MVQKFKNKDIFLAPHSPLTLALEGYLKDINIKGFIDKNKKDTNIIQIEELSNEEFDYIFILSPNYFENILSHYLPYVKKEKIVKVSIVDGEYRFENDFKAYKREFFYPPREMECIRKRVVFISKGFIGANNKALYLYCLKNKIDSIILTDNKEQIDELRQNSLPYELLDTKEADLEIATAKFIIFDQGNYTYLPPLHPSQKTVQLWHGVGLKKMNKLENIKYDYFISTSDWTNETNFKKIFSAKSFLNLGYPRNDIFFKDEDELDLMFCDRKIYEIVKKNFKKIILYMPTHRENQTKLNLDFQKLNQKLQEIDAIFILKLHPFMLDHYKNSDDLKYSNLFFHNAHGDIYPILKYVDTLVSDYSSVVYDFLLLDREVIFYNYDMDEYLKNVSLLFDYDEFSPGVKVKTQDELEKAISKQDAKDEYGKKREEIKELFFDKIARGGALKNIVNILAKDSM